MASEPASNPNRILPPPATETGIVGWLNDNLFSSWFNVFVSAISIVIITFALVYGFRWIIAAADWTVVSALGGGLVIGQFNTEQACPGQNCFWRPQAALLMVTALLGMAWGLSGEGTARRIAVVAAVIVTLFAFLPYDFERMGMDVRLLLAANILTTLAGWAMVRYAGMTTPDVVVSAVAFFLMILFLLTGTLEISFLQPAQATAMIVILAATMALGMVCGLIDGVAGIIIGFTTTARNTRLGIAGILTLVLFLLSFLPLGVWGWREGLLFLLIVPAFLAGMELVRSTGMSFRGCVIVVAIVFAIVLLFLRGVPWAPEVQQVSTLHWGGLMLNLLLAVAGIVISFPVGIALALGRRSNLPVVKLLCVVFIEVFRGVPLITLLFMSQVLVPLAFPENFNTNSLLRASIVITLFSSAYMAENVRGGLQALHPGQAEAARALGLASWQTTMMISLPQAIRNVIPAIVGQFIALFKDTTLVYIIGMLDVLEFGRAFIQGNTQYLASAKELFLFLAVVFWIFCYTMSYVSQRVEVHLGVGRR